MGPGEPWEAYHQYMIVAADPTLERLEDQIAWYDRRSNRAQRWFKVLKGIEIVAASLIPFAAGFRAPQWIAGLLGVAVVAIEGIQQLNQYDHNWVSYRSTCEALKHEKYLFLGNAGPYAVSNDPHSLLAERIESLISQEHAKWITTREEASKAKAARAQTPRSQ